MLAFSTSWQSMESITAEEMLAALKNLDISGIELSYRISEGFFNKMKSALKHSGLKVVSVHNYFPIPSVRSYSKGSGDLFLLSSCDDEERQNAIRFTAKSIEYAHEMGAMDTYLFPPARAPFNPYWTRCTSVVEKDVPADGVDHAAPLLLEQRPVAAFEQLRAGQHLRD